MGSGGLVIIYPHGSVFSVLFLRLQLHALNFQLLSHRSPGFCSPSS